MKTDALVALLAANAAPVAPHAVVRRMGAGLACGFGAAFLLLLAGFGLRADIAQAAQLPMFWVKLLFTGTVALAGVAAASRLARPGMRLGWAAFAMAAPVLLLWAMSVWLLADAAPGQRVQMLLGSSWSLCPLAIATISVPLLVAAFWSLRGLAPTRLALAGACAGLLAGAGAALLYALHCAEMQAPFLAVWYVAGMAVPTALGALLGPRWLRW